MKDTVTVMSDNDNRTTPAEPSIPLSTFRQVVAMYEARLASLQKEDADNREVTNILRHQVQTMRDGGQTASATLEKVRDMITDPAALMLLVTAMKALPTRMW